MSAAVIALLMGALPEFHMPTTEPPEREEQCGVSNTSFKDGEEIVYMVYYNVGFFWTAAGLVHFKVTETDSSYNVVASGSTRGLYDSFYRVRDTFETHLDKESLLPTVFTRDIEEGSYRKYNKFLFDQSSKRVISYEGRDVNSLERTDVDFDACMHDILSIVYHMRNMDAEKYEEGESFPVNVFLEEEYALNVKVIDNKRNKKIRGFGKFRTRVYEPQLIAGEVFNEDQAMKIYVSDDKNKLPLMIESPVIVGKIKAVLYDYRGLRHELSSKLD